MRKSIISGLTLFIALFLIFALFFSYNSWIYIFLFSCRTFVFASSLSLSFSPFWSLSRPHRFFPLSCANKNIQLFSFTLLSGLRYSTFSQTCLLLSLLLLRREKFSLKRLSFALSWHKNTHRKEDTQRDCQSETHNTHSETNKDTLTLLRWGKTCKVRYNYVTLTIENEDCWWANNVLFFFVSKC